MDLTGAPADIFNNNRLEPALWLCARAVYPPPMTYALWNKIPGCEFM